MINNITNILDESSSKKSIGLSTSSTIELNTLELLIDTISNTTDVILFTDEDNTYKKERAKLFVITEMLYFSFMDIFDSRYISNINDPFALLSKHFEIVYPNIPSMESNDKVLRYCALFSFLDEVIAFKYIRGYSSMINKSQIRDNYNLLIVSRDENNKITISINDNASRNALNRMEIYKSVLNGESDISFEYINRFKNNFLKIEDLQNKLPPSQVNNIRRNENNNSQNVVNSSIFIESIPKNNARKGCKVSKKLIDKCISTQNQYQDDSKLFDKLIKTKINEKRNNPSYGDCFLASHDINNRSYYDNVSIKHAEIFNNLNILSCKDGVLINDDSNNLGFVNHLVGATGSGKSITVEAVVQNARLSEKNVLYLTSTVDESIDFYMTMKESDNINGYEHFASLLFGQDKEKFLKSFIKNTINNDPEHFKSAIDVFANKDFADILDQLSIDCLMQYPLGMYGDSNESYNQIDKKVTLNKLYPCTKIKKESDKGKFNFDCPLYTSCGYHKRYLKMAESNLWIGNVSSLMESKLPSFFDTHNRSFMEMAILWADLIILDEADKLQYITEDRCVKSSFISVPVSRMIDDSKNCTGFLDELSEKMDYIPKYSNDNILSALYDSVFETKKIDRRLYQIFNLLSDRTKKHFTKKFTTKTLIEDWIKSYLSPIEDNDVRNEFSNSIYTFCIKYNVSNHLKELCSIRESSDDEEVTLDNKLYVNMVKRMILHSIGEHLQKHKAFNIKLLENKEDIYGFFEIVLMLVNLDENITSDILPNLPYFSHMLIDVGAGKIKIKSDDSIQRLLSMNTHKAYLPTPMIDINGYQFKETKIGSQNFGLVLESYIGKGRDVIYLATKMYSTLYNIPQTALLYTSATSCSSGSSLYNVEHPVNRIITNDKQMAQHINVKACAFYKNNKPIKISSAPLSKKKEAFKDLIYAMSKPNGFLKELLDDIESQPVNEGESQNIILILVNSYEQANVVTNTLLQNTHICRKDDLALLISNDYNGANEKYHIRPRDLKYLYRRKVKFLIAVHSVIARRYNILKGPSSQESLISKIIYTTRVLPSPDDTVSLLSLIHNQKSHLIEKNRILNKNGYSALSYMKQYCSDKYELLNSGYKFSKMLESDQYAISVNILMDTIVQANGRGLRGGTSVDTYLADGSYLIYNEDGSVDPDSFENKNSMVYHWKKFLNENSDDIKNILFDKTRDAFNNISIQEYR